jgi:hypothetical protein
MANRLIFLSLRSNIKKQMKKLFTLTVVAVAIFFITSCSKSNTSSNYFSFLGATYPVTTTSRDSTITTRSVTFADPATSETGTITCYFDSIIPATGGTYKIVGGTQPGALNQMGIQLTIGLNTYYATGNDNINATVTVSAAHKLSISIPSVWVASVPGDTLGPVAVDSSKVSAKVNE